MGIAIGIDLGGSKLAAGLVAPDATVKSFTVSPRPADPDTMVTEPLRVVAALKSSDVVAVGVGIGGLVADGVLTWGPNIPGEGIDYSQAIESAVELPVIVDNEVNLAAYAEAVSGAAVGFASVLMVTIGTGIGAGIVIDGRIYRGAGYAGEAGHINVHPGGRRCSCGQQGCWEAYASGRRLDELARTEARTHPAGMVARLAGGNEAAGGHAAAAAAQGDRAARACIGEIGHWLGIGLAGLIAVLDPEVIVLGGGVAAAGEVLLNDIRHSTRSHLEGAHHRAATPMVAASFGTAAGVVGAGLLALATVERE